MEIIDKFTEELNHELKSNILPYWINRMTDLENKGFYGRVDGHNKLYKDAPKGSILNSRILWTFSAAYNHYKSPEYKTSADHAAQFLLNNFIDKKRGGVYWMLDHKGKVMDSKKQIYALAFAIYGLAEYYKVFREKPALESAIKLFEAIESHSFDPVNNGYFEAYDENWNLLADLRLSDKDANEKKTMNTHLHILEAYTHLYQAWPDARVRKQLTNLLEVFFDKIIQGSFHFGLFFDENWNIKSKKVSFGHDIEGSWLMCEAADVLDNAPLMQRARKTALEMVDLTLVEGFDHDSSLLNDRDEDGKLDNDKHWWPQAEAMIALINAYELTSYNAYLEKAVEVWSFIKNKIIDHVNGEWFFRVNREGVPYSAEDKAGFWKCPYHNGRACLEIIRRLGTSR
jgi:mannobiose 2-epimerase